MPHNPNNLLPSFVFFQAKLKCAKTVCAPDPVGELTTLPRLRNRLQRGTLPPHFPPLRHFWRLQRGPRQPGGPRAPKGVKTRLSRRLHNAHMTLSDLDLNDATFKIFITGYNYMISQSLVNFPVLGIARPHCLQVAAVWTERSTCRLYPESKIDFFLRVSRS